MAEYEVPDPEDIMICPYNKAHAIRAKRMQVHLIKCRKQHEISRQFSPCPFNAKHEVPTAELRYHLTVCPDRVRLNEKFSHVDDNTELKGCTDVPAYTPLNIRGENWDDDIPKYTTQKTHAGYLPNSQFLRVSTMNTAGLTAKQKRDLYLQSKEAGQYNEEPKLRAPQEPSQAYSILLQQEKQKKEKQEMPPTDIYEFAFKKCAGGLGRGRGMVQSQQNTTSLGKTNVNLMSSSVTGTISNKNQESGGGKAAILTGVEDAACCHGTGRGDANSKGAWKPSSNFMASGVDRVSSVIPTAATGCSFPWSHELQRQAISLQNNTSQPPDLGGGKDVGTSLLLLQTTTSTSFDRDSRLDHQRPGMHMHHTEDRDMEPDEFSNTPAWVSGGYGDNRIGSWADEFPEDFPN